MSSELRTAGRRGASGILSLTALLVLFVGSGCAALIYEIVWLQLLQLVIGSSAVSLGVLLGTFMGGMCLGSLLLPRFVSRHAHPLRVYAWLEIWIGIFGVIVLYGVPVIGRLYVASVTHGFSGILLRGVICAVCLLPPTVLMGATLPAIARWIGTTGTGVSWLGFFYGANIAGAVTGCLLAGFYLLRVYDMTIATFVAVAINVLIGVIGLVLARSTPAAILDTDGSAPMVRTSAAWPVYVVIALSGFAALGAEVIWTRILSLMLGATTYTFSIILAVFLAGLGIGSSIGSALARNARTPRFALGAFQALAGLSIVWTAVLLGDSLPYWPVDPWLSTSPWLLFQLDIARCAWALLPAAIMWGASFPLALAAAAGPNQDAGRLVGGVYAANTVGAIAGAVFFSLVLIPDLGTQGAQRALVVVSGIAAAVALLTSRTEARRTGSIAPLAVLVAAVVLLVAGGRFVPGVPAALVAYGRSLPTQDQTGTQYLYVGEGMNASIAVSQLPGGIRNFHVSGKVEASSEPQDMRLQRMLANIPAIFHPSPKSVLVVGFGAGVTAGSFIPYSAMQRLAICEIEPLIPTHIGPYFARENLDVLHDPRVSIYYDDARHRVLTMGETFDIITSDPIHPWVKGAATLYTKEYFEMVRQHLNPGGLVTQWVPLYESTPDVVKSELATFFEVFPNGTVWANLSQGQGYDIVLLGQKDDGPLDVTAAERRLQSPGDEKVRESLRDVGFESLVDLLSTYTAHASDLRGWLTDAEINRDRNLRLQYLAGLQNNQYEADAIYHQILSQRRDPAPHLSASPELMQELRARLDGY
jgi:spermidine synthase